MNSEDLKQQLQRTGNAQSRILSQISREMRTSLDGIMGFTHLLASQRSGKLNDKQSRYVSEIYENGRQLHSLVNDYIDLAKLETGLLDLNYSELDVNEYLLWALEVLQPRMDEKKVKFSLVWETPPEKIQGDSARLKQIFYNVLSKAVEFSLEEERILLHVAFEEGFLKIGLKNEPSGIRSGESLNDSKTSHAEERVGQNVNPFDVSLALAQNLIQLHGGDIGLESKEDSGSYLWFTIPQKMSPNPERHSKEMKPRVDSGSKFHRILLVDDSSNMQNLVTEMLKREPCKVFVADNGQTGLEMAQQCRPDMIFMDINMPVMDGTEAIRNLRALPGFENLPVVALTAYDMKDAGSELLKMGFTHYLSKPFSKPDLLNAIHTHLAAE